MRKRFSERYGYVKPKDVFQIESMSTQLRNRLWNQFRKFYIDQIKLDDVYNWDIKYKADYNFFIQIYDQFFKVSKKPNLKMSELSAEISRTFFQIQWYEVYDFIEYVTSIYHQEGINIEFRESINDVLEEEMSGYRFIEQYITPIVDEVEIDEIEQALEHKYSGVKRHLSNALELLSDREKPDYINSIKESISAVEGVAQHLTGLNKDLGACIKAMDLDIQKQFTKTLSGLYTWTSQADGMRHAHTGEDLKTNFEEAKFMLVTCSAFINYLIAKKEASETR